MIRPIATLMLGVAVAVLLLAGMIFTGGSRVVYLSTVGGPVSPALTEDCPRDPCDGTDRPFRE